MAQHPKDVYVRLLGDPILPGFCCTIDSTLEPAPLFGESLSLSVCDVVLLSLVCPTLGFARGKNGTENG